MKITGVDEDMFRALCYLERCRPHQLLTRLVDERLAEARADPVVSSLVRNMRRSRSPLRLVGEAAERTAQ